MNWIGIPYSETGYYSGNGKIPVRVNCWELVRAYSHIIYDVFLPSWFWTIDFFAEASGEISAQRARLGEDWIPVDLPREGDVVVFRVNGLDMHVGILIGKNEFLHAFPGRNSTIESLTDINWRHRKTGIYRYIGQ